MVEIGGTARPEGKTVAQAGIELFRIGVARCRGKAELTLARPKALGFGRFIGCRQQRWQQAQDWEKLF
jgi:hypothetical protein